MNILEKATKILQQPVCDNCLGRQFAQLLSGMTNKERGKILRTAVAMSIDKSKEEKKEESRDESIVHGVHNLDMSNFSDLRFHSLEIEKKAKPKRCSVCQNFFLNLDRWVDKAVGAAKKFYVETFLVGTKLPFELIDAEEGLWEKVGIDYCESLKAEINREVGKLLEKKLKIKYSKNPDANFILNVAENKVSVEINPLFVYGEYQKLVRGIPQTKWPSKKYKTSVEEIIAKPFMAVTKSKGHKLHGLGREDIDARCLGWRPFVLELLWPKSRKLDLKKLGRKIKSGVKARKLRPSSIAEVRKIKEAKIDKTYTMIVDCNRKLAKNDLKRLKALKAIKQKTPERVLHRRADKFRHRAVKSVSAKLLAPKKFRFTVRCEGGLYVKELVSGDNGRTQPSVSQLLNAECKAKYLDVLKIHVK